MKRGKRCRCCGALDLTTSVRVNPKMLQGWSGSPLCAWCAKVIAQERDKTVRERIAQTGEVRP